MDPEQTLAVLANGMIPPDERDEGAGVVLPLLVNRLTLYQSGLEAANALSQRHFSCDVVKLTPEQVHQLLGLMREHQGAFFRQLRMDVCAHYLSDPVVAKRIGFPGPSTDTGGYPDFDQPQSTVPE